MRVSGALWTAALILAIGSISSPAPAGPLPGSLRVDGAGAGVRLGWSADAPPYVIYRSTDPDRLVDDANYVAVTFGTAYLDSPADVAPGEVLFYRVDDSFRCNKDSDCDNADLCDGTESCFNRGCIPGVSVDCEDGDACTVDSCTPSTGACSSDPVDCNDADPCTLDGCNATTGCEYSVDPAASVARAAELAGNSLASYPFFEYVRAFDEDAGVELAVDPGLQPDLVGATCDAYVLEARSAQQWCTDRSLTDVRGAPDLLAFGPGNVQDYTFPLIAPLQLPADAGTDLGRGYDVVLDCDRDGQLDSDERVDGLGDRAGLYLMHDLTGPGPLAVSQFDEIGSAPNYCDNFFNGGLDDLRVYYPTQLDDIGFVGKFPLVVVSHGNGHCFDWYDFLGQHLASYGYIVMAHDNDTRPGIEAASTTTLNATDRLLVEQSLLGGGVLDGHIEGTRIAWIGHSRGGEGVVRAYDRLVDEGFTPVTYGAGDIVVISSIAPTDFLGTAQADPHDVNYHLLYGSSDGDVCGCPNSLYPFAVFERADGFRHSTYVHGADHNDFNCCGFNDFTGPAATEIGRPEAQAVQKAILLATVKRYVDGNRPAEDYFWRQYERLRPIGVAETTVVVNEYRQAPSERIAVLEDFQSEPEPDPGVASSGGVVTSDVANLVEDQMIDDDGSFAWDGTEPMNGMTRAEPTDATRGAVFDYAAGGDAFWEVQVVPSQRNFSAATFLAFRAAQGTRHPQTASALEDVVFTVTLLDGGGGQSSIRIDAYGGGIEEPYQRGGGGAGSGWQNEFETIRLRLTDFLANGSGLDLTDIRTIRFDFGASFGSAAGRLGFDDIELTRD